VNARLVDTEVFRDVPLEHLQPEPLASNVIAYGLRLRGNPDHPACAVRLRQNQRHRLVRLAEAVGNGGSGLSDPTFFDCFHPDAGHKDLDQPPLQFP
jgi:hypothetical protein